MDNIEEFLYNLKNKAMPLQEEKIILLEKLRELTDNEETDVNNADISLKQRHIKVIKNRISEVEKLMGV